MHVPTFCTPFTPYHFRNPKGYKTDLQCRSIPLACAPPVEKATVEYTPSTTPTTPSLPPPFLNTTQALLDDMAERPQYYVNVSGVLLGVILSIVVLSATIFALDQLPLIPDVLRIIGLAYLFWFLGKFLLNGEERRRLQLEIDEFVAIVRGDFVSRG